MATAKREMKLVQFEAELPPDLQQMWAAKTARRRRLSPIRGLWGDQASEGFLELSGNEKGRYSTQTVALIKGLRDVLKEGSLLAVRREHVATVR